MRITGKGGPEEETYHFVKEKRNGPDEELAPCAAWANP